ncbi:MAG: ABC transporter substrate-binding protein [Agathobacter sp.]|nr:ABC transporter substrate-binding protein [Agathobacter sp.]
MKRIISILLTLVLILTCTACSSEEAKAEKITIAYQGGIGYAPIHILEEKQLIENHYFELTGKKIEVIFQKLDSGADINTGIIGGTIDIGCMGIAPAVSAVASGVPAKILTGLCSQTHGLMTNDPSIETLSDIDNNQIALVNIGSIQHILLAMAAEKELGDAHALDNNIVKMSHAEGYAALEAGTYKLHLTSSPYINRERENDKFSEIKAINEVWPDGNTFLVALASTEIQKETPELYDAIVAAFEDAITFTGENKEEAAEIVADYLDQDVETTLNDLKDETCMFFGELKGVTQMADFMFRAGFITKEVTFETLTFSNVKGD